MMFDPPDFPYTDLNETLKQQFGPEATIFSSSPLLETLRQEKPFEEEPPKLLSLDINTSDSNLIFMNSNDESNSELYIIQAENINHNIPVLLDDNTVNQFFLPLNVTSDTNEAIVQVFKFILFYLYM